MKNSKINNTKILHESLLKNNIEGLHLNILKNKTIVITPPIVNNNENDINNIYIHITNNKLVMNKITVDFGFFTKEFVFDEANKSIKNAINNCIKFIKDIIDKKIYSYKYVTCLNGIFMGYRNSEELNDIKEIFLKEDLTVFCLMYKLKEKKEPSLAMLEEAKNYLIKNKNNACVHYCLWNDNIVKQVNLYK